VVHPFVPLNAGNAHAFDHEAENLNRIVQGRVHAPQRALTGLVRLQKRPEALAATKPLNTVSVLPKTLTLDFALAANHRESPLEIHPGQVLKQSDVRETGLSASRHGAVEHRAVLASNSSFRPERSVLLRGFGSEQGTRASYFRRKLLVTTVTLESAIAAEASIGERSPNAATGIPSAL